MSFLRASLVCAVAYGCTTANGGAVDLSWKLRPQSGATDDPNVPMFLGCLPTGQTNGVPLAGEVKYIELDWEVGSQAGHSDFPCSDEHGVTTFDLPTGTASLSIVPLCDLGWPALAGTYVAPAPELRAVTVGATITLGALELIVDVAPDVADCPTVPCICSFPPGFRIAPLRPIGGQ